MHFDLDFRAADIYPEAGAVDQCVLLINHDGDYVVGTPFFSEDMKFICVMSSIGPIHPNDYCMWALLPTPEVRID